MDEIKDQVRQLAKYWDYERKDEESKRTFHKIVDLYLSLDPTRGQKKFCELSDKLAVHFGWMRTWPERMAKGSANPHPLFKQLIIKYIIKEINEAETIS